VAKPPILGQLRVDTLRDVPEEISPVLQQMFYALNPFIQSTKDAIAGKLGWENFRAVKKTVEVASLPFTFTVPELRGNVYWVNVVQAFELSLSGSPSIIPPRVAWVTSVVQGVPAVTITDTSYFGTNAKYRWNLLVTS
jgi:hypothetical protein